MLHNLLNNDSISFFENVDAAAADEDDDNVNDDKPPIKWDIF
jgi:hypothetical protein